MYFPTVNPAVSEDVLSAVFYDSKRGLLLSGYALLERVKKFLPEEFFPQWLSVNLSAEYGDLKQIDTSYDKAIRLSAAVVEYADSYEIADVYSEYGVHSERAAIKETADILYSASDEYHDVLSFLGDLEGFDSLDELAKRNALFDDIRLFCKARKVQQLAGTKVHYAGKDLGTI